MKTRLDLRNAVARHLGLVQAESEPDGWNAARIDEVIESEHRYLEEQGVAYWEFASQANAQQIPSAVFGRLTEYIAAVARPILLEGEGVDNRVEREIALSAVKTAAAVPWNGLPTNTDNF